MSDANEFIMLKDVRVSFPHLFSRPIINGEEGKCGAALMLEPGRHQKTLAALDAQISALSKAKFKGRVLPSDRLCLRDGEDKDRAEYDGHRVLSANSKTTPYVVGSDGRNIITSAEQCPIYAGCYVNAKVRLWAQDNKFGKRINCELVSIQFARDGESLDGSYVSADDAVSGFDSAMEEEDDFLATA